MFTKVFPGFVSIPDKVDSIQLIAFIHTSKIEKRIDIINTFF